MNQIVYDINPPDTESSREKKLVSWITGKVEPWSDHRDTNYKSKWEEYYRLFRGIWSAEDQSRASERSRLISPATAQAIEVATAEIEEAVFGKGRWFDLKDDFGDQNKQDMEIFRNKMMEDLNLADVPQAMAEVFLNGSIYGTGIGKITVEEVSRPRVSTEMNMGLAQFGSQEEYEIQVKLVPVQPDEFVIDPAARSIEEALGVAHVMMMPLHTVTQKQAEGMYLDGDLGSIYDDLNLVSDEGINSHYDTDEVKITEWHGLVPAALLNPDLEEGEEIADLDIDYNSINEYDLIEAIVTIGNDNVLLKAVANPYTMKDRGFIAYQHDTIPNQFWGRGITEKGYNSQKALDAELRGRMDAMALAIHPMMAIDATRLPRGGDLSIRAGKTLLTNGNPREVLMPFNFGQVGTHTFQQSGDMERMIQMATGAMDSAAPMSSNAALSTASGMSMMMSGAIKRSKRTMANIERDFIRPFVEKAAWRFMQFAPEVYPVRDYKFVVNSTLGIMARELEQQQLTTLLQTAPPDSPAYWLLIRGIYENSSITDKEQMLKMANGFLQQSMQPKQDQEMQLKAQEMQYRQKLDGVKLQIEKNRADTERLRVINENQKVQPTIDKLTQDARSIQVETNLSIREQDMKEKEVEIKEKKLLLDAELEKMKLEYQEQRSSETPEKSEPPVININGSSKKKITVTRTEGGLEGFSEEV